MHLPESRQELPLWLWEPCQLSPGLIACHIPELFPFILGSLDETGSGYAIPDVRQVAASDYERPVVAGGRDWQLSLWTSHPLPIRVIPIGGVFWKGGIDWKWIPSSWTLVGDIVHEPSCGQDFKEAKCMKLKMPFMIFIGCVFANLLPFFFFLIR